MNIRGSESMEYGSYPERPGEPDCAYYLRTGLCRFGMTCRFNHPPDRRLYYLKTGTCKFGATCKFDHPRDKAGIASRAQLSVLGYPLRPNEKECAYYLRTGQCKFGNTCKFHHPQPSNAVVSLRGSPVYPSVHSPTSPVQQSYPGGLTSWPLSRASFIASPRWQGPSSYAHLILPQGVVQVPNWNTYPGQLGSVSPSENRQQSSGNVQLYGTCNEVGEHGGGSSNRTDSMPVAQFGLQRESVFPERPDQPDCQFYMKTGDCKFGAACKFHHPRERLVPAPNCVLSPLGLPLRPGEQLCVFYSRYGICKFGPNCKFDHPMPTPMGIYAYSVSTPSPSANAPAVRRLLGSPSGPSESRQMASADDNVSE